MIIGIPKERRAFEYRVGLSPAGIEMLTKQGHTCYVERDAGIGAGFQDQDYENAGARIIYSANELIGRSDLLLKVARPLREEIEWLRPGTAVAGFLHLGSARQDKIDLMLEKKITSIAYEQIRLPDGTVPVRQPLSQIGGTLAAQIGASLLQNNAGGKGVLVGGVPGVPPAETVIIGAGTAGTYAARAFCGMHAHITVLDVSLNALQNAFHLCSGIVTMIANPVNIARAASYADILVGAIWIPNEPPPKIISREIIQTMKPRSVVMDICIDEGGCIETSHPTNHEHSIYVEEGVVHYCVPNMSSVVARSSTYAYLAAAFPYIMQIANHGIERTMKENPAVELGVGTHQGDILHISSLPRLLENWE